MSKYPTFGEFREQINEKLMTFGGKAYPKFGQVVALAGGAGSGKGFILKNLMGIEGKVLDVDAIKELSQQAPGIIKKIKAEFGVDISKEAFPMKNPENVSKLHVLLADEMKLIDKNKQALFTSVLTSPKDRKPNIIFDVTMKNMKKFNEIAKEAKMLGYDTENIHIVWVVNDVEVAMDQNRKRSRTVPVEILMDTHVGAQQTMFDIIKDSEVLQKSVDGDIIFAFNKAHVDATIAKSDAGGMYIKDANYVYVKRKGKRALSPEEIGKEFLAKIATYTPNAKSWKDLMDNITKKPDAE